MNKLEEIQKYYDMEGTGKEQIIEVLEKIKIQDTLDIPVCILSHMYSPKRSTLIVQMVQEAREIGLDRPYIIFTYADQKELYKEFENIPNVTVHYIPTDNPVYLSLSGKRQYILEYTQSHGYDDAFFIEDDCSKFYLPAGGIGGTGNFRNAKFFMTLGLTFSLWEQLIKDHQLTYSGPYSNMAFTFSDLRTVSFIKDNVQVVQAVHINVKSCKEKNINFDHDAGWDDYDMVIQQCVYNQGTQGIMMSYCTPSLKSGTSTMSSTADALAKRCEVNTTKLINKWGLSLVREDTKKGLYNAKINWYNIRPALNGSVPLEKLIGLNNEEAKAIIQQYKAENQFCRAEMESSMDEHVQKTHALDDW